MSQVEIESPDEVMRQVHRGIDAREELLRKAAMMGCAGNYYLAETVQGMQDRAEALAGRVAELEQEVAALARRLIRHEAASDDRVTTLEESLYRHQGA